ncbi:MAG: hypothetical protein LBI70_03540 [Rickettsiales bacterium]|jgi:molybdenum cofactor biosynthesis enzyme MoaA|nr:hypothetical protein [Rickettsiales bacterium]
MVDIYNATVFKNILDFATEYNLSVKLIELYPESAVGFVSLKNLEDVLRHFLGAKFSSKNGRQIIYQANGVTIILTRVLCAAAKNSIEMSDSEFCKINQDFFITPDGGTETCAASDEGVSIYNSVKNRDESLLRLNFEKARLSFGNRCLDRKIL